MAQEPLTSKDTLEHAWRYFALHAGQRMSMFNYFLILFGLVAAGLAGCLRANGVLRLVGTGLGAALCVVAFAFWKLDQRSAFLVKHAESALRKTEATAVTEIAQLFHAEPNETRDAQLLNSDLGQIWTYGKSFRLIFVLAGLVGLSGAVFSFSLFQGWIQ